MQYFGLYFLVFINNVYYLLATPLHWIYDQDKVKTLTSSGPVEFYPSPQCPYYHVPTGVNSAYGSQLFVTLRDVAQNKGNPLHTHTHTHTIVSP